jgi:hypothetical protein
MATKNWFNHKNWDCPWQKGWFNCNKIEETNHFTALQWDTGGLNFGFEETKMVT